jgi:parallel beta-helix repeat protein
MFKYIIYSILLFTLIGCGGTDNNELSTTYFVSPLGDDNNDGTEDSPFKTIQEAVDTAQASDTIYVKSGTYKERISFNHSGKAKHPIVVKKFEQDTVIVDGTDIDWNVSWGGLLDFSEVSYIDISGLEVINSTHAGVFLDNCHHITIENSKTHNTYSSGIGVWYSHNVKVRKNEVSLACNDGGEECISIVDSHHVVVEYNEVHHNGAGSEGGEGIDVKQGSHDVMVYHNEVHHLNNRIGLYTDPWDIHTYNITFDGNSVHDCTNFGMAIASEMGGLIEHVTFMNNLIYHNFDGGMAVGGWTADGQTVASNPIHHITIINNTIYDNRNSDGLYIANPYVKDIKVYNNIIGKNDDSQIYIENTPLKEVKLDSNLVEGITGQYGEEHQIVANPIFVDVTKGDFHLKANSPAINRGVSSSVVLHDFDGNKRPKDATLDIGAYEF